MKRNISHKLVAGIQLTEIFTGEIIIVMWENVIEASDCNIF